MFVTLRPTGISKGLTTKAKHYFVQRKLYDLETIINLEITLEYIKCIRENENK